MLPVETLEFFPAGNRIEGLLNQKVRKIVDTTPKGTVVFGSNVMIKDFTLLPGLN
jgi:hypothetical protein